MFARSLPLAALLVGLPVVPSAQSPLAAPPSELRSFELFSGEHRNAGRTTAVVHAYELVVPDAHALRLFFRDVDLGPADALRVTSLRDLEEHRIDRVELAKWRGSSAWLNGDHLLLELELAPGSRGSWHLSDASVEVRPPLATLCGGDDRVPATDGRIVRLLSPAGANACSGFVVSGDDCVVTAGHCLPSFSSSAEVHVPLSQPDGSLNHPGIAFQFAVDPGSLLYANGGIGDDWGIVALERNVLGQSVSEQYGTFSLASSAPAIGTPVAVTGYGNAPGVLNQTLLTDAGALASALGTYVTYPADTESGSSGSPVVNLVTGEAVGIHAVGSCSATSLNNGGTAAWHSTLLTALGAGCFHGPPAPPVAGAAVSTGSALTGQPVRFDDLSTGEVAAWAWDFDGDGTTDSTVPAPVHVYDQPGTYTVSLTVSNALGASTHVLPAAVVVRATVPAGYGLVERFEGTFPPNDAWYHSASNDAGAFSAQVYGPTSPQDGGRALHLFSSQNGVFVTNEVGLALDVSQGAGVVSWWFRDVGDEDHPEDGVFLTDGQSEVQLVSHQGLSADWTRFEVDLAPYVAALGTSPSSVRVLFRQHDNWALGSDGHGVDLVRYEAGGSLTLAPSALSVATGGTATFQLDAGPAHAGEYYVLLGTRAGTSPGLSVLGTTIPLAWSGYLYATLTEPNSGERTAFQGLLDGAGRANAWVQLPAGLPVAGQTLHYAFAATLPGQVTFVSPPVALTLGP